MRYVRSFLLALTTLAFFLLVLVAGLYVFITPERVSARLANTLSHHLGLKIEMAKLHIDTRLPSLKFTVKDAVLTSADGTVRGSVPSATIRLHPLALFTRSPRISEITTADGSLTFGNTSPEDVRAWIEGTVKPLAFNVDHLVVHRGAVYFSDPLTGPEPWAYVNNASVSISNLSEAGAAYSLNGVIKLPEMLGSAELRGITDWSRGLLEARTEQLDASFKGEVRGRRTEFAGHADRIALTRENASLSNVAASLKRGEETLLELSSPAVTLDRHTLDTPVLTTALTVMSPEGSLTLSASSALKADFGARRLEAPSITVAASERAAGTTTASNAGSLTGSLLWNASSGEGRAEFDGTLQGTPVTLDLSVSNAVPFTADRAFFPHKFAAIPRLTGRVSLGEIALKTAVGLMSSETLLKDVESAVDFNVMLKSPHAGRHEATGRLITAAGKAYVVDGSLKLPSAPVPFDADLAADGTWHIRSQWSGVDAGDLLPSILSGPLSGSLDASGQLKDASKSVAEVRLEARDGEFLGADLEQASKIMREVQPEALPTSAFLRANRTAFTALSCELSLNGGAWTVRNGSAEGSNWKAAFTGAYGHIDGRVDFTTDNGSAFFTMPARIQADPVLWTPDWTAAHASAREHVGELPWTAGNFKDRLRQGLENWWNNLDASELKLPEFNTEDFSLPEFRLPDIELPDWANEFIGKEKAPENSDARNPV